MTSLGNLAIAAGVGDIEISFDINRLICRASRKLPAPPAEPGKRCRISGRDEVGRAAILVEPVIDIAQHRSLGVIGIGAGDISAAMPAIGPPMAIVPTQAEA